MIFGTEQCAVNIQFKTSDREMISAVRGHHIVNSYTKWIQCMYSSCTIVHQSICALDFGFSSSEILC